MFHLLTHRRFLYAGGGMLVLLFLAYVISRSLPPSQQEVDGAAVTVSHEACYTLEADGKAVAYFADYDGSFFTGGSVSSDSVRTRRVVQRGWWVNRLPVVPSCFGHVVIQWGCRPSTVVNLGDKGIRQLLRRFVIHMDGELGGLQTKRNELGYYLRVHSVQDYGYNRIADYHAEVLRQMDSLRRVMKGVEAAAVSPAKLRIRQQNRYAVVLPSAAGGRIVCNRRAIYKDSGAVLLRTASGTTPLRVTTRMGTARAIAEANSYGRRHPPVVSPQPPGIRFSGGRYEGETRKGIPEGYGMYHGDNGSFYDGHWKGGRRNGFGIYVAPYEFLQVGEWKEDVFKGERLTYTADRIYGIDLSRYQHEKNKKVYRIHWDKLRITDLGTLSSKTVKGKVDYPVSFVYVKSTEGCTVLNAYYPADYAAARKHGIRTGTYHFFSTKSDGAAQAGYFLRNSRFSKGDLPPVLDVEPTDAQIAAMGGAEVMFRHIRAWMSRVHKETGRRPVLYISQMFANTYMPLAHDLGDNYHVWIARYGAYKPDFKLAYWQLSPDGRVRGIHGDVDINVFNGYRNQYEEFLRRHCF